MIVGELLTELGFTFDENGLKKAEHGLADIKHALVEIATVVASWAVVHELRDVVNETTNAAFEMAKTADTFGITTKAFETMGYAAGQTGVTNEELYVGLKHLSLGAQQAAQGSAEAQKKFAVLGVSLKDAQGNLKPINELFSEAADKIKGISNPTKQAGLAQEIFGRSGTRLLPLLKKGSEGIEAYEADIKHLGAEMSGEFIADSRKYRAEQQRHKLALEGLHIAITKAVLPAFIMLEHYIAEGLGWINRSVAGTHFLEAAFASLGIVLGVLAIKAALPFLPYIAMAAAALLATFLIIAVVEDLWSLFHGGPSAIGQLSVAWTKWIDDFVKPHADDNWLQKILRWYTRWIFDIPGAWDSTVEAVKNAWTALFAWFDTKFQAVKDAIKGTIPEGLMRFVVGAAGGNIAAAAGSALGNTAGAGVNALFGGGGVAAAPGPWAAGQSTVNSQPTFNMTINSGSADPNAVAVETRRQIDAALESHAQDIHSALVPGLAPLGGPD